MWPGVCTTLSHLDQVLPRVTPPPEVEHSATNLGLREGPQHV